MPSPSFNKYRAALRVLQKGRDLLAHELADTVLDRSEDLLESPYLLTELVETQGSKLHYLAMLMAQLEQSAEDLDAAETALLEPEFAAEGDLPRPPRSSARRRSRNRKRKKLPREQASAEGPQHDQER